MNDAASNLISGKNIYFLQEKEKPFLLMMKKYLWDENLSLEALGLWLKLLCEKDHWSISLTALAETNKCEEEKIIQLLNELVANSFASCSSGIWYIFDYKVTDVQKN